jgi:hypothetical protein
MNIFTLPKDEINKIGFENQIYGFPTPTGLKKITNELNQLIIQNKINYISGIDLGCGDGKTIDYFNKNIFQSNWIGIELSEYRINMSSNPDIIIEGDLLDLNYKDYNFLFINNLAFDDILLDKIETKIYIEFEGYLLLSKSISNSKLNKIISIVKTFSADTNWQKNHTFYLYLIN